MILDLFNNKIDFVINYSLYFQDEVIHH